MKVLKNWYDTDGSDLENNIPKDVEVTLYRSTFENSGEMFGSNVKVRLNLQLNILDMQMEVIQMHLILYREIIITVQLLL